MKTGKCGVSIAALQKEASLHSEMISQILYGETFEIIDQQPDFTFIKCTYDGFEGWISNLHWEENQDEKLGKVLQESFSKIETQIFSIGSEIESSLKENTEKNIGELARDFLETPFLSGGRSFFGTDAASFVQLIYKVKGISLHRQVSLQAESGEILAFVGESREGDLAFFDNENGEIIHVGMMLNNYEVIHCFGKVRIDPIDSTGIFNKDLNKYTHILRFIKRIS